jgi:hypothetical protein
LNIEDAFEESFRELGLDLDGDPDDILTGADESDEAAEAEDGPEAEESVDEQATKEDALAEDDDETEPTDALVVDIPEGAVLRLPDGTEVDSTQAVLLQKDYTKKTQQLAEERKAFETQREEVSAAYEQMRGWYEERASDPTGWVQEIVSGTDDPTATIARALYELANAGKLDPAFVATFGIDAGEVAEKAKVSERDRELDELRKKIEQRERTEQEQEQVRAQAAVYQSQWEQIKATHGVQFDSPDAEREAKKELLEFALQAKLGHSLPDAYDLMLVRTGRFNPQSEPKPAGADPAVAAKKRASRAVTQRSEGGATAGRPAPKAKSTREAALEAISEFAATR